MARIEVLISGYVRTQVVVSDKDIDSPVVENPDFFWNWFLKRGRVEA